MKADTVDSNSPARVPTFTSLPKTATFLFAPMTSPSAKPLGFWQQKAGSTLSQASVSYPAAPPADLMCYETLVSTPAIEAATTLQNSDQSKLLQCRCMKIPHILQEGKDDHHFWLHACQKFQKFPELARICQKLSESARTCRTCQHCSELLQTALYCSELLRTAQNCSELLRTFRELLRTCQTSSLHSAKKSYACFACFYSAS